MLGVHSFPQKIALFGSVTGVTANANSERPVEILTCFATLVLLMALVEGTATALSLLSRKYPELFDDSYPQWWMNEEPEAERMRRIERALCTVSWCSESQPSNDDACCAVCLSDMRDKDIVVHSVRKCCKNIYHKECLSEWLKIQSTCPCCRTEILFKHSQRKHLIANQFSRHGRSSCL